MNLKNRWVESLLKKVDGLEGWLLGLEPFFLLHLPMMVDHLPGALVEIGSYKGKSTAALALGSQVLSFKKRPVYAIDPFTPHIEYQFTLYNQDYYQDFLSNIQALGLSDHVIPIKKYSNQAYKDCPPTIAGLFVDGDHTYQGVMHDIEHYASRVVPGGLIAFHDYDRIEVKEAVDEICDNVNYEHCCDYRCIRVVRKLS
ncbi:class I SAM-dependent methyltransferase [Ammoniphilus sp. CFH 90114]|uniref:class I SAM-dependent methyltransferase n=1 Tax=Ammoniphilus sp. CFH 90114 TaxID=2493665 RepID=UPI00100F60F9|nr:class I SAM-dependent methyltransferase [Ammoniphilus sp. CFH 90114]RXT13989.1 class I SAM-dependent methyltransferase [Ammoniphilus sp. CFH 90114]